MLDGEIDLLLARLDAKQCHRLLHDRSDIEALPVELHLARLDLGQIEDVVDQVEQVPAAPQNVLDMALLILPEGAEAGIEEQLREADDGVERRAQLVRHVGEEFAFHRAGALQLEIRSCSFSLTISSSSVRSRTLRSRSAFICWMSSMCWRFSSSLSR